MQKCLWKWLSGVLVLMMVCGLLAAIPPQEASAATYLEYDPLNPDMANFPVYPAPGGVGLSKEAEWTKPNFSEAQITMNVYGQPSPPEIDVLLVLDTSGSMDGGPLFDMKFAVHIFLEQYVFYSDMSLHIPSGNHVSILTFDSDVGRMGPPNFPEKDFYGYDEIASLEFFVDNLKVQGTTNYVAALAEAANVVNRRGLSNRPIYVVFMSDGAPNIDRSYDYTALTGITGYPGSPHIMGFGDPFLFPPENIFQFFFNTTESFPFSGQMPEELTWEYSYTNGTSSFESLFRNSSYFYYNGDSYNLRDAFFINLTKNWLHEALDAANPIANGVYTIGFRIEVGSYFGPNPPFELLSNEEKWLTYISKAPGSFTNARDFNELSYVFNEIGHDVVWAMTDAVITDYAGSADNPLDSNGVPYYFEVDPDSFMIDNVTYPLTESPPGVYKSTDGATIIVDKSVTPNVITWNLGSIKPGGEKYGEVELKYKVTLDKSAPGGVSNVYYTNGSETAITYKNHRDVDVRRRFDVPELKKDQFTVTYLDFDGTVIEVFPDLNYGEDTPLPDPLPVREGYRMAGWRPVWNPTVTEDVTYTSVWVEAEYTVQFIDYDGTELATEIVIHGEGATAPTAPGRTGYTFVGWDKSFDHVTGDLIVTALYEAIEYTVTFVDDEGNVLKEERLTYGSAATAPTDGLVKPGLIFDGWDVDFSYITDDLIVTAQYKDAPGMPPWLVEFVDWNGEILKEEYVDNGEGATAPADPDREGYVFAGWDREFDVITGNLVVSALYDAIWYTVTFVDYDGTILDIQQKPYGASATAPSIPGRHGYDFAGWDEDFSHITDDLIVTALYEKRAYTVEVKNSYAGDGDTGEGEYEEGDTVTIHAGSRNGYTFTGWTIDLGGVVLVDAGSATTDFTMTDGPVTVTANWRYNGGNNDDGGDDNSGGGGGGGPTGGTTTTTPIITPTTPIPEPADETEQIVTEELVDEPEPLAQNLLPDPPTTPEGNSLELTDEGNYIEIGADGTPLGEWHWDEEIEEWVFEEYPPPLAALPDTRDAGMPLHLSLIYGFLLAGLALTALTGLRRRRGAHQR